jgi:hypothetical protein
MAKFDVSNVVGQFLRGADTLPGRPEIVMELGQSLRTERVVVTLLREVASECRAQRADAVTSVKVTLGYGLTIGIFLEKELTVFKSLNPESRHPPRYAVGYVVSSFLNDSCPDQDVVARELAAELRGRNPQLLLLCAEVAHEVAAAKADYPTTLQIALLYGVVVGVFLEKNRVKKGNL